jgi:hypothetical protein
MSRINDWTPDQAWVIYQWVDQIREEILQRHKESIRYFQWQEKRLEEYAERVEQISEKERMEVGIWLEPKEPDDPIPF